MCKAFRALLRSPSSLPSLSELSQKVWLELGWLLGGKGEEGKLVDWLIALPDARRFFSDELGTQMFVRKRAAIKLHVGKTQKESLD